MPVSFLKMLIYEKYEHCKKYHPKIEKYEHCNNHLKFNTKSRIFFEMSVEQIVEMLIQEINEINRKEVINTLEEKLIANVKELSKNEKFFQFPFDTIFSVVSRINFNSIDESDDEFEILHNIIKNTIREHSEEKETLLILQNINIAQFSLSHEKILSIFELFKTCPITQHFLNTNKEKQQEPEIDYEYELREKDKEIENLKQIIELASKPQDFESNIFEACRDGKLTSVQWLIEKEHVDKNKRVEFQIFEQGFLINDTPIHIATKFGHLPIVQYLIEEQNVDIDIKGSLGRTPLHYAIQIDHHMTIKYLFSKSANFNAKDDVGESIMDYAKKAGILSLLRFSFQNDNKEYRDEFENALFDYASKNDQFYYDYLFNYRLEHRRIDEDSMAIINSLLKEMGSNN